MELKFYLTKQSYRAKTVIEKVLYVDLNIEKQDKIYNIASQSIVHELLVLSNHSSGDCQMMFPRKTDKITFSHISEV